MNMGFAFKILPFNFYIPEVYGLHFGLQPFNFVWFPSIWVLLFELHTWSFLHFPKYMGEFYRSFMSKALHPSSLDNCQFFCRFPKHMGCFDFMLTIVDSLSHIPKYRDFQQAS